MAPKPQDERSDSWGFFISTPGNEREPFMRRFWACILPISSIATSHGWAQEKPRPIPPRFKALTKNASLRLERVLGLPELPASNVPTPAFSTDGKLGLYAEDLSSG